MALELDTRFAVPLTWSDINDPFPGPDDWAGFFDSLNDLAAQDTQGLRAARPAAVVDGTTGGAKGGYYWATDGTAAGATKDLARSDGAAWWSIALLAARADFTVGVTVAVDATAQQTSAYAPLGVTRSAAAGAAFLAFNRSGHASRPALGVDAADDSLLMGLATNLTDLTALAALKTNGELDVVGADHRLGANARGAAGTQVHLGSRGDAANAYVGAEGSASNIGLILRGQGTTGAVYVQPDASTTVATFTATAATITKATAITAGGLAVTAGITAVTGNIVAAAGDLKAIGAGGVPRLYLKATDAGSDAKVWDLVPTGNTLIGRVLNDAENASATWLTVTRAAASPTSIQLAAAVQITAGGLQVAGSALGYTDEIRYSSTASGAVSGLVNMGTGTPQMLFDHRGAPGSWHFRNGVAAANQMATLTGTGDWSVAGHLGIAPTFSLRDSTTSNRMVYHDTLTVYLGAIDGSRSAIVRGGGLDVMAARTDGLATFAAGAGAGTHEATRADTRAAVGGTGFSYASDSAQHFGGAQAGLSVAVNRATPAVTLNNAGGDLLRGYAGSTQKVALTAAGGVQAAGHTHHLGVGALGATGAVLTAYADAAASDVWLYARAQDLATYRKLELRASNTRFWDAAGNVQAGIGTEADLFSLDTSLFVRWRDGIGNTFPLQQVRLATGASIRTGAADSLYFLRLV